MGLQERFSDFEKRPQLLILLTFSESPVADFSDLEEWGRRSRAQLVSEGSSGRLGFGRTSTREFGSLS